MKDFVAKIVSAADSQGHPGWDAAKKDIYISLYPSQTKIEPPFAKDVGHYCCRFFILNTPSETIWVTPGMVDKWGTTEGVLEQQALANGNLLLAETDLAIENVKGHPLGSFKLRDRTLNAALLMAPGLKDKVRKDFGWPLYAVIPEPKACRFFGKRDFEFFEENRGTFVADGYESPRHITPELLEFNDAGIKSICTWVRRMGYIMKCDSDGRYE